MIVTGQTLKGPIIVIDGPLDIQEGAELDGDAWIVNGSLVITGSGVVRGQVTLVNSERFVSHSAELRGVVVYYECECRLDAERYEKDGDVKFVKEQDPMALKTKLSVAPGTPTRVRYDVLRLGAKRENKRRRDPYVRWEAMINVPLYKSTQHGFLGFDAAAHVPLRGHTLGLDLAGYKSLHSEDFWQVPQIENALLLVTSADEYANYYEKRGGEVGLTLRAHPSATVGVKALYQRDVSMTTQDEVFTILGSRGNLALNPPVDDGDRAAVRLSVTYDTRLDRHSPANAWMMAMAVETGRLSVDAGRAAIVDDVPENSDSTGTDRIDYTAFTIQANRYTLLPLGLQWDVGARLSSSFDAIPRQLYQTLNGYGGVRGPCRVPFGVASGDRLVRLSTEIRLGLPDIPVVRWIYSSWDVVGFADAGLLAQAENPTSPFEFLETPFNRWKKSAGLGVSGESFVPYLGFYVAQEIDGERTSPRFIIRIERSF